MLLDLFKQFIPWLILATIIFFLWLAFKNYQRAKKIRYSGRISEIIDRRRNFVICLIISSILFIFLLINLLA